MKKHLLASLLAAAIALPACGGDQVITEGVHEDRPAWVDRGGKEYEDKALYGVGVAGNVSSVSLRRSSADAQARAELAKLFQTRVQNLMKNYEASTGDADREAAESHRQEATKAFAEMDLTGAEIVERFYDHEQKVQYSLARIDAKAFAGQLEQMETLSGRARQIIRDNAARAFEEIDAESEKRAAE